MNYCPKCRAEVHDGDAFCSNCGTPLAPPQDTPEPSTTRGGCFNWGRNVAIAVVVIAVIMIILTNLFGKPSSTTQSQLSPEFQAANIEVNCEGLVKKHLVSPATMKVPSNNGAQQLPDGSWVYDFAVDSENSFGGLIRSHWHCEVHGNQVTVHQTQ